MCVGEVATVTAVDVDAGTATIRPGPPGTPQRTVSLTLRPDTAVGARVVVHTGFVVDHLNEAASSV